MTHLAIFGIDNDALSTAVNVLLLMLVVVWFALIFWTFADARRRIDDPMLVGCAVLAAAVPFVGTIVYMIVRPPEFLDDVRLRELEMHAAEARLQDLDHHVCSNCGHSVRSDYLRCPNCERRLKEPCRNCSRPLESDWNLCPYCETEVLHRHTTPPATPASRRSSSRRKSGSGRATAAE